MPGKRKDEVWADVFQRKHEFGPSSVVPIEVFHEGRRITLLTPSAIAQPERIEVRTLLVSDDLIVAIASHTITGEDDSDGRGILMVGRKRDDSTHLVHVWHEVFPQALKLLGLDRSPADSQI